MSFARLPCQFLVAETIRSARSKQAEFPGGERFSSRKVSVPELEAVGYLAIA